MELGLVNPDTMVDANAPMRWGKFQIKEFKNHNYGPLLSVTDVIVKSSNVGTAKMALKIGGERQQAFFKSLGLFEADPAGADRGPRRKPAGPANAGPDIVTITTSYGHGMSVSPMHLAAAYATIANGGVSMHADPAAPRYAASKASASCRSKPPMPPSRCCARL